MSIAEPTERKPGNTFNLIRLVAALLVILAHSFDLSGHHVQEPSRVFSRDYMSLGTLAVFIFFSLSGHLIAKSYEGSDTLTTYLRARALRIYPALFVVIILTVFVFGPVLSTVSLADYFSSSVTRSYLLNTTSTHLYFFLPGVFEKNPIDLVNGALWSLPYEIICYIWVAQVGEIRKRKIGQALFLLLLGVVMVFCIGVESIKNIIHCALFFAAGAVQYHARSLIKRKTAYLVVASMILVAVFASNLGRHSKDIVLCLLLPYVVVSLALLPNRIEQWTRRVDISYGLYIYGWPVQQTLLKFWPDLTPLQLFVCSSVTASLFAMASWHLIERRALKYKRSTPSLAPDLQTAVLKG